MNSVLTPELIYSCASIIIACAGGLNLCCYSVQSGGGVKQNYSMLRFSWGIVDCQGAFIHSILHT